MCFPGFVCAKSVEFAFFCDWDWLIDTLFLLFFEHTFTMCFVAFCKPFQPFAEAFESISLCAIYVLLGCDCINKRGAIERPIFQQVTAFCCFFSKTTDAVALRC